MNIVEKAKAFATIKHDGQVDKSGREYIYHPLKVSETLCGDMEKVCGLLHDTVEDTDCSIEEIEHKFGKDVSEVIDVLTHRKSEEYFDYIERVKSNPVAVKVKMADLAHNMDLTRLNRIGVDDILRLNKYKEALYRLRNN